MQSQVRIGNGKGSSNLGLAFRTRNQRCTGKGDYFNCNKILFLRMDERVSTRIPYHALSHLGLVMLFYISKSVAVSISRVSQEIVA